MILYLGSSSLIKLYAEEPFSDVIADWVAVSEIVATCRVAYTEILSAFDDRVRKGSLSKESYEIGIKKFTEDWPGIAKIDFDDVETGRLIGKYGLPRFGALHLSAAKLILEEYGRLPTGEAMIKHGPSGPLLFFSSADRNLCKAAAAEGLKVLPLT